MDTHIEKRNSSNKKSTFPVEYKADKRYHGRCCFGLLSLRSGIYIVSATSFIVTLYGLREAYPRDNENIDNVTPFSPWSKHAFSVLSFCTDAVGSYEAYRVSVTSVAHGAIKLKSSRAIKHYKRMICVELILELACITTAYTSVYISQKGKLLDPESLAKGAIETEQDLEEARKMFTLMLVGMGAVGFLVPSAIEGFRIYLAGRYQRFLEEDDKSSLYRDEEET